jgi:photosystem II stability/assembly factor-like uncharacterized protein
MRCDGLTRRRWLGGSLGAAACAVAGRVQALPAVAARIDRVPLFDAAALGPQVVTVGERGVVFVSDDRGAHWRQVASGTESDLTAVHLSARGAVAVGHRGHVVRSAAPGQPWLAAQVELPEDNSLFDVVMNGAQGWAVGAFGVIAQTLDGGASWRGRRAMGDDFDKHLYGIARTSKGELLVAGESGTLLFSGDGGASWQERPSPYVGSFFGVAVLERDRLLVHGMRGHAYHSDDAAASWRPVQGIPPGLSIQGARRLDDGRVTLAGLEGGVFVSRDNGATFTMQRPVDRRSARVALAGAGQALLVFGEGGFYKLPASR